MPLQLGRETRARAIASIRRFLLEELEQEVGDLKAGMVLDYFLREIGPSVYNLAVRDAQTRMQESVADLDGSCYEAEFRFWSD